MSEEIMVEVWLPLKSYKLKIKHSVLAELGELSHFVINAMSKYELTMTGIYNVTGLTENQLKPIIERLQGLRFIDSELKLTEQGSKIAYVLASLHNKELDIYMDQNYASHRDVWFMALSDADCVQEIPKQAIEVKLPGKVRNEYVEDCFLQTQRFQKNCREYLLNLVPEFKQFADLSESRWGLEWEISFRSNSRSESYGLAIQIPLKRYKSNVQSIDNTNNLLRLYTPVLQLITLFSQPLGFNWQNKNCIKPVTCFYSEHDDMIYEGIKFSEQSTDGTCLVDTENLLDDETAYSLIEYVNNSFFNNPLYSIEYKFSTVWQSHEYSYHEIVENIKYPDVIKGH